ncbi:hypothetical protein ACWEVD_00425 [Nocardia thailandica]
MSYSVGDRVRVIGEATATDLEVLEIDVDGNPSQVRVQPVADTPGTYAWVTRAEWLRPAPN